MKNILKLGIAAFTLCLGNALLAQNPSSIKEESVKASETLSRPSDNAIVSDVPQTENKQEPVKKEKTDKKEAKPSASAPAKSKESSKSDKSSGTQKMAIAEQGINKNNNKPKAAATKITPPPAEKNK